MSTAPYDPTIDATVGVNSVRPRDLEHAALAQTAQHIFRKGVVVEVLGDPQLRNDDFFKKFDIEVDPDEETHTLSFRNQEDLARAPRNSLVIRDVTEGAGRDSVEHIVCFPFFSSHMMLPVKPGETVWFSYTKISGSGSRAYWLSRICDVDFAEDANFTHHDRRHDDVFPDPDGDPRQVASLHNGADPTRIDPAEEDELEDEQLRTLPEADAFVKIRNESLESGRFVIEPVPRITKLPGDLVLQGSNNASITLGTDRGFNLEERPDGEKSLLDSEDPLEALRGTIDLVTGRGRFFTVDDFDAFADDTLNGEDTRPSVTKNAEEDYETEKNKANNADAGADEEKGPRVNLEADPNEGDSDFINDASRIYVSTQTNIDANFGTVIDNIPEAYDEKPADSTLQNVESTAAVAIKSDEIRIIARNTGESSQSADAQLTDATDAAINGSIRIIKEGDPKDDAASIYLLPDGTIQITGKKIMIGKSTERDEGTAKHSDGEDANGDKVGKTEPYMRYTEFKAWAEGLIDAINTAIANAQAAVNANGDALNGAGSAGASGGITPGFGAPNAGVGAAFGQCIAPSGMSGMYDSQPDQDAIEEFKDTSSIKSNRIFGE
jgi:hypothetical protein